MISVHNDTKRVQVHIIIFIPANSPWLCKVQTVMAALAAACLCDCLGSENFTWNIHTLYKRDLLMFS